MLQVLSITGGVGVSVLFWFVWWNGLLKYNEWKSRRFITWKRLISFFLSLPRKSWKRIAVFPLAGVSWLIFTHFFLGPNILTASSFEMWPLFPSHYAQHWAKRSMNEKYISIALERLQNLPTRKRFDVGCDIVKKANHSEARRLSMEKLLETTNWSDDPEYFGANLLELYNHSRGQDMFSLLLNFSISTGHMKLSGDLISIAVDFYWKLPSAGPERKKVLDELFRFEVTHEELRGFSLKILSTGSMDEINHLLGLAEKKFHDPKKRTADQTDLLQFLKSVINENRTDEPTKIRAVNLLGKLADSDVAIVFDEIKKLLLEESFGGEETKLQVIENLVMKLKDDNVKLDILGTYISSGKAGTESSARIAAIKSLGRIGSPAALQELMKIAVHWRHLQHLRDFADIQPLNRVLIETIQLSLNSGPSDLTSYLNHLHQLLAQFQRQDFSASNPKLPAVIAALNRLTYGASADVRFAFLFAHLYQAYNAISPHHGDDIKVELINDCSKHIKMISASITERSVLERHLSFCDGVFREYFEDQMATKLRSLGSPRVPIALANHLPALASTSHSDWSDSERIAGFLLNEITGSKIGPRPSAFRLAAIQAFFEVKRKPEVHQITFNQSELPFILRLLGPADQDWALKAFLVDELKNDLNCISDYSEFWHLVPNLLTIQLGKGKPHSDFQFRIRSSSLDLLRSYAEKNFQSAFAVLLQTCNGLDAWMVKEQIVKSFFEGHDNYLISIHPTAFVTALKQVRESSQLRLAPAVSDSIRKGLLDVYLATNELPSTKKEVLTELLVHENSSYIARMVRANLVTLENDGDH